MVVAAQDAGAVRYFTRNHRVIDLIGLNDHRLVQAGETDPNATDSDGDGIADSRDLDSDNDGLYDDGNGVTISHSFPLFGSYPVGLQVTDDNDPALPGHVQSPGKPVDEDEVAEMIDCEMLFDAVDQLPLAATAEIPRIAHEYVECRIDVADRVGTFDDRIQVGQFEPQGRCRARDAQAGRFCPVEGAARAHDVGAAHRQHAHGFEADARRTAGHDRKLAARPTGVTVGVGFSRPPCQHNQKETQ